MCGKEVRLCGAGATLLLCLGCGAGNVAFREGRKAELRKDYDTALVDFEKALQSQPDNAQFLLHEKYTRAQASFFHLKQGRRYLAEGRLDEAAGEFQKAVSIDPTNEAAAQELGRLLAAQAAAKRARENAIQQAMKQREEPSVPAAVHLKPFPTDQLQAHLHFGAADSRKIFEALGKLAGLNVAFTSDFQPKPVPLDLTNVTIEEALRIYSYQTKTFWKAITPNTILVIPDTQTNHRDFDDEVLKTVYLSNPLADQDRAQVTAVLTKVLGLQKIVDNKDSNAIIIRDTPGKVAAAEKLIHDLDHGKAEVLVDVTILEADRTRMRELGIVPATNLALVPTPTLTTSAGGTVTTSAVSTLTLSQLGHINSGDYSLVLPSSIASAVLNDSRTRILQNPQLRSTDGLPAKEKIGTRVPFAQGSFLPSFAGATAGGGGFGLLAQTQFQYQDVGVSLDVTPHVLASGEVSLHAVIEITSVQAPVTIGGISEPTFGQRRIEHDIRLKEGEVSVLGGLIQRTVTQSVTGLPGLAQVPLLRYLFSSERREQDETEILVMLTPRVIRLPEFATERGKDISMGAEKQTPTPGAIFPPEAVPQAPVQPQ